MAVNMAEALSSPDAASPMPFMAPTACNDEEAIPPAKEMISPNVPPTVSPISSNTSFTSVRTLYNLSQSLMDFP